MDPKLVVTGLKVVLKSKKLRKIVLIIITIVLLVGAALAGLGFLSVKVMNLTLLNMYSSLPIKMGTSNQWVENVTASELFSGIGSTNIKLSVKDEENLRFAPGKFEYLLQKIVEYEEECQSSRTITIEGFHQYTETVESTNEEGESESEEVTREEYVQKEIEVTNAEIEGLHKIDWRMLYIYSLLAALDRREINVVSVDSEDGGLTRAWVIQEEDIDRAFEKLSMRFYYAFDVLRDHKNLYSYEECCRLPHVEDIHGDPETEEGKYTFYHPRSLLNNGSSGYSTLIHTQENGMITGVEEVFNPNQFTVMGQELCQFYDYQYWSALMSYISGGLKIKELFDWYIRQAETGNAVMHNGPYQIDPGEYEVYTDEKYIFGENLFPIHPIIGSGTDVGSAAVQLALSRLDWKYSQGKRYENGFWDCSSMVSRIYHELGVEIPIESTTTTLLRRAIDKLQAISIDDLMPGDILLFRTQRGVQDGNLRGVGHVVMYAGNGMIVHAASTKLGTVYQPLVDYYNYPDGLILCARPYQNLKVNYAPSQLLSTQAAEIAELSDRAAADYVLERVKNVSLGSGILPSIVAGQMILESGFCRSELALQGNNCFGMKRGLSANSWPNSTWDGISILVLPTKEQNAAGTEQTVMAAFRKYNSIEESIADHNAYLLGAKNGKRMRYEGLTRAADYEEAARIIKQGGYATDIQYVEKLCNVIKKYDLDKYDKEGGRYYDQLLVELFEFADAASL